MPVWPKFVYTLSASRQTAATQRKLRDKHAAVAQQDATFRSLIARLAATTFWRQRGIERGITYAQFQARVPLHTYAQIAPAVGQMRRGEKDVLWPGTCALFGLTSGTSTGESKCLPMTDDLLAHFRHAGAEALLYYTARVDHAGIFRGRHLYSGATTDLRRLDDSDAPGVLAGEVSGIAARNFPPWVARHLIEPSIAVPSNAATDVQQSAIAARGRSSNVTLLAGLPGTVTQLAEALRDKFAEAPDSASTAQECWRSLECIAYTGAPVAPHAASLHAALGKGVMLHEVFAASEGVIAAQDGESTQGLRLMADMGIFFEFVPLTDFDDLRLERLTPKVVPLSAVRTDVDYVMVLTTPGGLARYVLGDVVRFTSLAPPRLIHVGGTELRLNAFAENVSEREATSALVELCERRAWTLVSFHVAPLFPPGMVTGQRRGAHEWWIELKPGTTVTPTGPQIALELDAAVCRLNRSYAGKRSTGAIDAPVVRLVMPGVFEHWLRFREKWGGQYKMPRCRSDRRVADEFARMTNFAKD